MSYKIELKLTDGMKDLFKATASDLREDVQTGTQGEQARQAWAASFGDMLVKTMPVGGTVRDIFEVRDATGKTDMRFLIEPNDVVGWVAPRAGTFAKNYIQGDVIYIPWDEYRSSVYYPLTLARDADFDVPSMALQKLNDSLIRLEEQEGWMMIRTSVNNAPTSQRIKLANGTPGANSFSKELFSAMLGSFEDRNIKLDAFYGPTTMWKDLRTWVAPDIDPVTQQRIYNTGSIDAVWGIPIIPVPVIEYYRTIEDKKAFRPTRFNRLISMDDVLENGDPVWNAASKTLYANGNLEVVYAISRQNFGIYAIKENVRTVNDPTAIKEWEQGILAAMAGGFAVTDPRNVVMGIVDRTQTVA